MRFDLASAEIFRVSLISELTLGHNQAIVCPTLGGWGLQAGETRAVAE